MTTQQNFKAVKEIHVLGSSWLQAFGNHHQAENYNNINIFQISKWGIICSQEQQIMTSTFPSTMTSIEFPSNTMTKALVYQSIVYTVMVWLVLLSGK